MLDLAVIAKFLVVLSVTGAILEMYAASGGIGLLPIGLLGESMLKRAR